MLGALNQEIWPWLEVRAQTHVSKFLIALVWLQAGLSRRVSPRESETGIESMREIVYCKQIESKGQQTYIDEIL